MLKLRGSLAARMTLWFVLLSLLIVGAIVVFARRNVSETLADWVAEDSIHEAQLFASQVAVHSPDRESIQNAVVENSDETRLFLIVDMDGNYVAHPDQDKTASSIFDDFTPEIANAILGQSEGAISGDDAAGGVIAHTAIPEESLIVVALIDQSLISTPVSQIEGTSFTQIAAAVLIVSLAGGVVTWINISPIQRLTEATQRVGEGNLEVRVDETEMEDELRVLAGGFNLMAEQLQELFGELELRIQEAERARREAQEANRLKDIFLATMSHELRTPLNAIIGFMGLMQYSEKLDEDDAHMAERVMSNANRLFSLINNVLDLSRISASRFEILPVEMSPRALAEKIHRDMELQFREKGLAFHVDFDDTLPETTFHDEERIIQIATNLLNNSAKFTDEGNVWLAFKRDRDRLIIEVADTGIGIPPAKQHLIFDEFTQVDGSPTRKHGGAGLGLAIVKRLAVLMGGNVSVSSEVGKGSVFIVDLPLKLEPVEPTLSIMMEGAS